MTARAEILNAYLYCALWTEELENAHSVEDFTPEAVEQATQDIETLVNACGGIAGGGLLAEWPADQIGHDLWLTRNGHGAGFWDRSLPNSAEITDLVEKNFSGQTAYVCESGKIHLTEA